MSCLRFGISLKYRLILLVVEGWRYKLLFVLFLYCNSQLAIYFLLYTYQ